MAINGILHDIKKTVPQEKLKRSVLLSKILNEKPTHETAQSKFFEESQMITQKSLDFTKNEEINKKIRQIYNMEEDEDYIIENLDEEDID